MNAKHLDLKTCLAACLFLFLFCALASAQKKPADETVLRGFEKSFEQGKINEIERPLLDFAIANPNNTKALELLARVRVRQGRSEEARGLYKRILTLEPNSVTAKIQLARVTLALGEKEEAREILREIEPSSSIAPSVQLELAEAFSLVGDFQKALTVIDKLPSKFKNNDALPLLATIYLESGDREKLNSLIPLMNKAATAIPALAAEYAEVLQNAGMNKEAAALLRPALAVAPKNAKILVLLGRLEVFARDFDQARAHLLRAAALEPRSTEVLSAQALLENATGNMSAAFSLLDKARRIAPDSPVVLADFVLLAMRAGKSREAVRAAKILLEKQPENPEFQYLFGAASLQNGNIGAAQDALERLMLKRPNDSRGCLALGLTLAAQREQFENARKQLNRCLEIDSANFEARYQLGLSYKAQGEIERAVGFLEEVIRQVPNYAPALRDLGALYLQKGAEPKAREMLERAVSLSPQDADTHFQLSRLYNQIGESALARRHLETFQKLRNQGGNPQQ